MLARGGRQLLAFTRRDAVRLLLLATVLVAGLTSILAFEDLGTARLPADPATLAGWALFSILVVGLLLAWVWRFRPRLWHRNNAIMLLALTILSATLLLAFTGGR